ncbi:MAG: cytochrome c [Chloroflexi bacterium]|nr:cytochrome c [Chloroflexota bacterium]
MWKTKIGRGQCHFIPRTRLVLIAVQALLVAAAGCIPSGPSYPFDIFPEMHYSAAVRRQEPPRLDPPAGAVPIVGRSPGLERQLENPVPRTPDNVQRAAELYQINCRACHGVAGRGNGLMAGYFAQAGLSAPSDFANTIASGRTDSQIYFVVENGLSGMPPWRNLLSAEERWLLVHFVRSVGGAQ